MESERREPGSGQAVVAHRTHGQGEAEAGRRVQRDHPALLEHDGEPGADEEGGDVVIVTPEGFDALFKRAAGVRGYPEAGIAVLVDGRNANLHCRHEGDGTMAVHARHGSHPTGTCGARAGTGRC